MKQDEADGGRRQMPLPQRAGGAMPFIGAEYSYVRGFQGVPGGLADEADELERKTLSGYAEPSYRQISPSIWR